MSIFLILMILIIVLFLFLVFLSMKPYRKFKNVYRRMLTTSKPSSKKKERKKRIFSDITRDIIVPQEAAIRAKKSIEQMQLKGRKRAIQLNTIAR